MTISLKFGDAAASAVKSLLKLSNSLHQLLLVQLKKLQAVYQGSDASESRVGPNELISSSIVELRQCICDGLRERGGFETGHLDPGSSDRDLYRAMERVYLSLDGLDSSAVGVIDSVSEVHDSAPCSRCGAPSVGEASGWSDGIGDSDV